MRTLDGYTILRFTHAGKSGGGIETYLDGLDSTLLTRNKAKVIRMYLEEDLQGKCKVTEEIGLGNLVQMPLEEKVESIHCNDYKKIKQAKGSFIKGMFRDFVIYNPLLYRIFFRKYLKTHFPRQKEFGANNARETVKKIFEDYNVDLVVMHYIGGVDSAEIIEEARVRRIPYLFLNHFSNDSFNNISIREQLNGVAGIAGVSAVGVPRRLKNTFMNLSDGIDTEVFNLEYAQPIEMDKNTPIIIYPARIVRVKGQIDLIKACAKLRNEGLRTKIVLVGRTDSREYEEELKELASKSGLKDDVLFLGQLSIEQLRDWYGVSSILGFPTYHNEGLPRILLEAQAMKVTPVVYDVGGLSEGIQHEKTGYLVRKGDIATFTKYLRYLLTNKKQREKMGEEGRKFIESQFSLEALTERHEKYYLKVLKSQKEICVKNNA